MTNINIGTSPPDHHIPKPKRMPTLGQLKSDMQLLEFQRYKSFCSATLKAAKHLQNDFTVSVAFIASLVWMVGRLDLYGKLSESEFIKLSKAACEVNYFMMCIVGFVFELKSSDIHPAYTIMSRDYFLYLAGKAEKQREIFERYEDAAAEVLLVTKEFLKGDVFHTRILISEYAKVPYVSYDPAACDENDIRGRGFPSPEMLSKRYPDVFDSSGTLVEDVIFAKDLVE